MKPLLYVVFYIFAFTLFLLGAILGLLSLAGVLGVFYGPEVFAEPSGPSNPWDWAVYVFMPFFVLFGIAAMSALVILPLAALCRVPLIEKQGWRRITRIYCFLKRSRYEPDPEQKKKNEKMNLKITQTPWPRYYLTSFIAGILTGFLWSLLFFPIMRSLGSSFRGQEPGFYSMFILPPLGFGVGAVFAGLLIRFLARKNM